MAYSRVHFFLHLAVTYALFFFRLVSSVIDEIIYFETPLTIKRSSIDLFN